MTGACMLVEARSSQFSRENWYVLNNMHLSSHEGTQLNTLLDQAQTFGTLEALALGAQKTPPSHLQLLGKGVTQTAEQTLFLCMVVLY